MADNGFSPTGNEYDHFPTFEDRARSSSRKITKSGRVSPSHSAHCSLLRSSLTQMSEKRAKKVRFYRNGDRFYNGMIYAVSIERFRTFESLLAELTNSPICDRTVLPKGVRHMYTLDGSRKIVSLDQLEEGESYVCASTMLFQKMDYPKSSAPNWNPNIRAGKSHDRDSNGSMAQIEDDKDFIKPKLVTVIRNGSKPRKAVRILLNRKTAHSFDQVLNDVTDAIKLDSGAVKKVFTVTGKPVSTLQDFFGDENVFIAYGPERYALDDFDMGDNEIKFVSAYRSVRNKERITLKSPKAPRRLLPSSSLTRSTNEQQQNIPPGLEIPPRRPTTLNTKGKTSPSPKPTRKTPTSARSKSPGRTALTNGNLTNGINDNTPSAPKELTSRYRIGKVIGEGNFATVKECQDRHDKMQYALKIINKNKCKGREQMIDNEVNILRSVKHPNIVQLIEDYDTPSHLYLVMELVTGGDLFEAITMATKFTERDASGMLYNLASAVKYLHTLSIVHRDIKPENLLVYEYSDGSKSLKLGDFGLATVVEAPLHTVCGTPTYVAPEVIAETGYGVPIDVWSAGVITYILLCGFPPFVSTNNNQDELFDRIMAGHFEYKSPFWDNVSDSAKELISEMLHVDPQQRISAADALDHPWVCDDTARDQDIHTGLISRLEKNFTKKTKKFSKQPGVNVLASTPLDKQSRFFQGRGQIQPIQDLSSTIGDDEVF